MKKTLLLIAVAAGTLLVACKKNEGASAPGAQQNLKTYPVSFNVNTFSESATTLNAAPAGRSHVLAAAAPLTTPYLTGLFYRRDNSRLLAKVVQVKSSTPNFGTITAQLPLGDIKAYFIATDDTSYTVSQRKATATSGLTTYFTPILSYGSGAPTTTSLFTAYQFFTVSAAGSQSVSLTRAVSRITIKVDDNINPMNYGLSLTDSIRRAALDLGSQKGTEQTSNPLIENLWLSQNQGPNTFDFIVYPGNANISLKLTYTDPASFGTKSTATRKTILKGTIKANTHYTFEGYFSNLRNTTTAITADTSWNAPVNGTFARHYSH